MTTAIISRTAFSRPRLRTTSRGGNTDPPRSGHRPHRETLNIIFHLKLDAQNTVKSNIMVTFEWVPQNCMAIIIELKSSRLEFLNHGMHLKIISSFHKFQTYKSPKELKLQWVILREKREKRSRTVLRNCRGFSILIVYCCCKLVVPCPNVWRWESEYPFVLKSWEMFCSTDNSSPGSDCDCEFSIMPQMVPIDLLVSCLYQW